MFTRTGGEALAGARGPAGRGRGLAPLRPPVVEAGARSTRSSAPASRRRRRPPREAGPAPDWRGSWARPGPGPRCGGGWRRGRAARAWGCVRGRRREVQECGGGGWSGPPGCAGAWAPSAPPGSLGRSCAERCGAGDGARRGGAEGGVLVRWGAGGWPGGWLRLTC